MKTITKLLSQASKIIKEYEQSRIKNGDGFNIFRITGIQSDEVKMCRMLAEIIDPKGTHNQGFFFIRSFVKRVLGLDIDEDELASSRVYAEYHTEADRRIDIAIVTNKRFVPIEVKIYAEDQTRQCKDYYDFALNQKKPVESKVYYLTLDGHLPQKSGTEGLTPIENDKIIVGYEEITAISFRNEICSWLEECLEATELTEKTTLRINIEQFVLVIGELSGNMSKKISREISNLISGNSETFAAASAIAENVQEAKKEMLCNFFSSLELKLATCGIDYEPVEDKYNYRYNNNEAIEKFYSGRKTRPSLTYRCKKIDETKEIWFRVEVDHNLYCGFVIAQNGDNPGKLVMTYEEIEKHIEAPHGFCEDSWWFYWEYLLNDSEKSTPNFINTNETLIKLFDSEYFGRFVDLCAARIIELTKEMKIK